MPSISKEDYLKSIYSLSGSEGRSVATTELAGLLGVSKAAVSEMTKRLAQQDFVTLQRYKGVRLTSSGKQLALQILRRHRLWELFLIKVLDVPWSRVHQEAETLEHHSSDFLIDEIERHLDYPEFDPHGDPIPGKYGELPAEPELIALAEGEINKTYTIERVTDKDIDLVEHFTKLELILRQKIIILEKLSFDNSLLIKVKNSKHTISETVAANIFVKNG